MLKLFCWVLVAAPSCLCQSTLVRESIGQQSEQDARKLATYYTAPRVELSSWVGNAVIFLPRDREGKSKPYPVVSKGTHEQLPVTCNMAKKLIAHSNDLLALAEEAQKEAQSNPFITRAARLKLLENLDENERLSVQARELCTKAATAITAGMPYDLFAGRLGRVAIVEDYWAGVILSPAPPPGTKAVYLVLEDDRVYIALGEDGIVDGLALLSDIELGRRKWRGLQVHPKIDRLLTYSAETDKYGTVEVSRSDVLTIADVVAGFESCAPARVVLVTAAGLEGYQDLSVSGTNCRPAARFPTFTDRFEVVDVPAAGR
jgi:hypothetical protein